MKKGKKIFLTSFIGLVVAGSASVGNKFKKKYEGRVALTKKLGKYYHILNEWLAIYQKGNSLVSYFIENGYKTIAIYGFKELGERLYDELKNSDIEVKYIIDREADNIFADVDLYTPDDVLPDVDIVIVTASYYFDEIESMLSEKLDCLIIPIEDVVYSI